MTASFDELMKMQNLIECEEDALRTLDHVRRQVNEHLKNHQNALWMTQSAHQIAEIPRGIKETIKVLSIEVTSWKKAAANAHQNNVTRERVRAEATEKLAHINIEVDAIKDEIHTGKQGQASIKKQLTHRLADHCKILSKTFPIEAVVGRVQEFCIRGLYLPRSDKMTTDDRDHENVTAAALGVLVHVLDIMAGYLDVQLPYPMTSVGSQCTILDPISTAANLPRVVGVPGRNPSPSANPYRIFPLTQVGAPEWRFNWAVWILGGNLEAVMAQVGLKRQDPRNMLANLKYLLAVCSSEQPP